MPKPPSTLQLTWKMRERQRLFNLSPSTIRATEQDTAEADLDQRLEEERGSADCDFTELHSADEIPY
jgi:hypothetical protein